MVCARWICGRQNLCGIRTRDAIVRLDYKYLLHPALQHRTSNPTIMSERQHSASQISPPVESQSVLPPPHGPLHPPTPPHPYRIYGYKLNREWFAKFAKDHNIGKPDWDAGAIESAVLGYLTLRLPGFQIHAVDNPLDTDFGYSICISLATNWNRKKLERAASRVPTWMELLGTEEKPRWYKPTVDTIPPIPR